MQRFHFPAVEASQAELEIRARVREFLQRERETGGFVPRADCWVSAPDAQFSRKVGEMGWLGMTWPTQYGGQQQSPLMRLAVTEELLAAGAPVAAHWVADRQSGPHILKYGTEQQKDNILPKIVAGECFFAIGMSEPQAGSDLAAVTTKAEKTATGWRLNGRKIWSTGAHISSYMIVLARTSPAEGRNRHVGLSQFLVDLSLPGISISGIEDMAGGRHFNETLFEDVELTEDSLLGEEGRGWAQVMGELAMERSGPERFLTTFVLIEQTIAAIRHQVDFQSAALLGRLYVHLVSLRRMSRGIARLLEQGESPETEAALVKQLGNQFEKDVLSHLRKLMAALPPDEWPNGLRALLEAAILRQPSATLRGGTTEIMRGIIARQLGVR